jgi:N-formylglutamate amidohydrolase
MENFDKIVLNIPHSSINGYYRGWEGGCNMFPVVKQWTDWHTDTLFNPFMDNVEAVIFPYSRFFCDVERLRKDPLEEKGQGLFYTDFDGFHREKTIELYKEVSILYERHHWSLTHASMSNNTAVIIDCHSFPSVLSDIDVCIGFNEDDTKPSDDLINYVSDKFKEIGLIVGINEPYSNSIVPDCKTDGLKSFMIELRKGVYMNEDTLDINTTMFYKVKTALSTIYRQLLK